MKSQNHPHQVVKKYSDHTVVWNKNSNGNTTKDGYRDHHKSGNVTNYYGKIVGRDK